MAALNGKTIICIKSQINNKYLRYQAGTTGATYDLLEFSTDNLFDPYVQIEVVKTDDSDLVHLKSQYNNKSLIRQAPDSNWITASADFPINDKKSWDCTFFKPILIQQDGDNRKVQFQHVQLGYYLTLGTSPFANCLYADRTKRDVFDIIDWDSVIRFKQTRKVVFRYWKDDKNYLGAAMINGRPYLQFNITDPKAPEAAHEIIPSNDGFLHIKSTFFGKYWRIARDDYDKIVVDVNDPKNLNSSDLAMFRFSVLDVDRIALLSASKVWYCKRHNLQDQIYPNVLAAVTENVDQFTALEVFDLDNLP